MAYNPAIHNRRSIRIKDFDYSGKGNYFVTICCERRRPLFGEIVNGEMQLNAAGEIARQCWMAIPSHFPHVVLEEFVIMPDHVHGLIRIVKFRN
jgi:putative transposase